MKISVNISEVPSEDKGGYCIVGRTHDFIITPTGDETWSNYQAHSFAKYLGFDVPDIDQV